MERLGQMDPRVVHHLTYRIVFFFPSEGKLRERGLIPGGVLYVDEVLLVRDSVVLGQLKEANEGLQQRSPVRKWA